MSDIRDYFSNLDKIDSLRISVDELTSENRLLKRKLDWHKARLNRSTVTENSILCVISSFIHILDGRERADQGFIKRLCDKHNVTRSQAVKIMKIVKREILC